MESKEDTTKQVNNKNEKVVYKVVHVPYYYPVPVDAEWYYKHYDRFPNDSQFPDHPPQFEHFIPPPGFPPPRRREYRDHYDSRDEHRDDRSHRPELLDDKYYTRERSFSPQETVRRSISPKDFHAETLTTSPIRVKSPHIGNKEASKSIDFNKDLDVKGDATKNFSENKETSENIDIIKAENSDEDKEAAHTSDGASENNSENNVEINRKRKRYLMTFPYDQRKKRQLEEHEEMNVREADNDNKHADSPSRSRSENGDSHDRHYHKRAMMSPDHQSMIPSHVPYVMVPIRSSQYIPSEMHYEPRYHSSRNRHQNEPYHYDKPDDIEDRETFMSERREMKDDDDKREVRYHPNGRRARTVFTRQQLLTLNNVFEKHPFVSGERMSELSDQLGLDRKIVKIWFQNKRQYARKKGSLVEREEDYYYDYPSERYMTAPPPTMAERWKQ